MENSNGNQKKGNEERDRQHGKKDATGIKEGAEICHQNEGEPGGYENKETY